MVVASATPLYEHAVSMPDGAATNERLPLSVGRQQITRLAFMHFRYIRRLCVWHGGAERGRPQISDLPDDPANYVFGAVMVVVVVLFVLEIVLNSLTDRGRRARARM